MQPYPIQPNTGGPIDPHDVIGRDAVCRQVLADFAAGDQRLVDPRRLGKTSLLERLSLVIDDPKTMMVMIDFQGTASSDEFYARLVNGLGRHATFGQRLLRAASSLLERTEVGTGYEGVTINASLRNLPKLDVIRRVLDSVRGKLEEDELVIIACDEVPLAIENVARCQGIDEARLLLQSLRALRSKRSRVRWLLTGSVGFHHVVRLVGGTEGDYNDLATVQMGPLDVTDATYLTECLLLGIGRGGNPATPGVIAALGGGIPWLIHQVVHRLPKETTPATPEDATLVFDAFVADRSASSPITHLVTRVAPYYGPNEQLANRVLDHLAIANRPVTVPDLRKRLQVRPAAAARLLSVVDMLDDDHYLVTRPDGVAWRYDVLRRIWILRKRLT